MGAEGVGWCWNAQVKPQCMVLCFRASDGGIWMQCGGALAAPGEDRVGGRGGGVRPAMDGLESGILITVCGR